MELTTMLETMTVDVIPSLAMHPSEAPSELMHGTLAAFIIVFWTIRGLQPLWASRELRARPSCRMKTHKVLSLASTSI